MAGLAFLCILVGAVVGAQDASPNDATGPPGKPWSGGQLSPGESRRPMQLAQRGPGVETGPQRSIPEKGQVHIGTHQYYRDSVTGVRKIDKVMSSYIQGICTDFRSETRDACEQRSGPGAWFPCPENYPHADSKKRNALSHIPVCYKDRRYAMAGKGPPGSWCVPSHLVGFGGGKIAVYISRGEGKVCDNRYRALAGKDSKAEKK
jgi:hypothetical protein